MIIKLHVYHQSGPSKHTQVYTSVKLVKVINYNNFWCGCTNSERHLFTVLSMFILRGSQWMILLSNSVTYTKSSDFSNIQQIKYINSIYRCLSVMLSSIGGCGRSRERRTKLKQENVQTKLDNSKLIIPNIGHHEKNLSLQTRCRFQHFWFGSTS